MRPPDFGDLKSMAKGRRPHGRERHKSGADPQFGDFHRKAKCMLVPVCFPDRKTSALNSSFFLRLPYPTCTYFKLGIDIKSLYILVEHFGLRYARTPLRREHGIWH